jgi:hypothetical protein
VVVDAVVRLLMRVAVDAVVRLRMLAVVVGNLLEKGDI